MSNTTCQICARHIKTMPSGLIAHHGYTRPGDGYQTQSCDGAKQPPYEVSVDFLRNYVPVYETSIKVVKWELDDLAQNPPPVLRYNPIFKSESDEVKRPKNFSPEADYYNDQEASTYKRVYENLYHRMKLHHQSMEDFLKTMKQRLSEWKKPN